MPARPIASASIAFGLVSVPVKLYSSSESTSRVSFNWLDKKTGSRLKQQYIRPQDGERVERSEMIKGYEYAKGQFVTFTPEELKAIEEKSTQSIEITEFVDADQIDPVYREKTYYLGPDKGGDRAYKLLSRALADTGKVAVAKYSARGKQYLVAVRPRGDGLVLEQLYYPDEIRSFSEVPLGEAELKDAELTLAVQLVEQAASGEFKPDEYRDEVRERVLELIQKKVDGEDITIAPSAEPQTKIIDLMEALKASLAQSSSGGARKPAKPAASEETEAKPRKAASS